VRKGLIELLLDLGGVHHPLVDLGLVEGVLDGLFDLLGQHGLDEFTDELTVDAVAIGHREEMRAAVLTQVRQDQERVLIGLVWILGRIACLCGKCELGHAIIEFLACLAWLHRMLVLRCAHFF